MEDLKLSSLLPRPDYNEISNGAIKSSALHKVRDAFIENWQRVEGLIDMVHKISSAMRFYQAALEREKNGTINDPELLEIIQSVRFGEDPTSSDLEDVEAIIKSDSNHSQPWLASILLGAWSAFEVLVADLWIEALNSRPSLGFRAFNAEITDIDDEDAKDRKEKIKCSIVLMQLREWNFNLQTHMGDLLSDKWNFSNRDLAVDAYKAVFHVKGDSKEIGTILKDQQLSWLYALRNAIVHNGAKADTKFRTHMKRHPVFKDVELSKTIGLDGKICANLLNAAYSKSVELFKFVDTWLQSNPEGK